MHIKCFILDCQNYYYKVSLNTRQKAFRFLTLDFNNLTDDEKILLKSNTFTVDVHPITLSYWLKELTNWNQLYWRVISSLKPIKGTVLLRVIPVDRGVLDLEWAERARAATWHKVEEEDLMSWLSTLGGAFSALGDSFGKCAETAGKISIYQLKIAMRSGDPAIVSRCKLYYSISLIQKGQLRAAKQLVRDQYALTQSNELKGDDRLYKMCHGIWLKLQYSYHLRKQSRQNGLKRNNNAITT